MKLKWKRGALWEEVIDVAVADRVEFFFVEISGNFSEIPEKMEKNSIGGILNVISHKITHKSQAEIWTWPFAQEVVPIAFIEFYAPIKCD